MSASKSSAGHLERGRERTSGMRGPPPTPARRRLTRLLRLAAEDLERLAWAAELSGDSERFLKATERVYDVRLAEGALRPAARAAFWVGFRSMSLGEAGRANAWLGRAQRLVEGESTECAEQGFLLLPLAFRHQMPGQLDAALDVAAEAAAIGDRVGDADLSAFGRTIQGRALIRQGQIERGMALLDESMLAATANRLSPIFTGLIYCTVIASCQRVYAIERAREWTAALSAWCEGEPRAVPFHGPCLVHRAELLQIGGAWPEAIEEARSACSRVRPTIAARSPMRTIRKGRSTACGAPSRKPSAASRRRASTGKSRNRVGPLAPGQGQREVAQSAIRRVVAEAQDPLTRAKLLPAAIEIHLAVGDVDSAREACAQLDEIAASFATEVIGALAAHGRGRIHLAEGDAQAALGPLRRAFWVWQKIGAPYPAARVRVDLARACQALGDGEGARMELEAARVVFEELGAVPDVAALGTPPSHPLRSRPWPHPARAPGAAPRGRRQAQQGHRPRVVPQRKNHRPAPQQHLRS